MGRPCGPFFAVNRRHFCKDCTMVRILFQTGGPYHPVGRQAELLQSWLPADWRIETAFGADVFDQLAEVDLYVAAGLHGMELEEALPAEAWTSAGVAPHGYTRPTERQKDGFRHYVAAGRPVLAFHGGIVSYGDWPEYGRLLGFRWDRGYTGHSRCAEWKVQVDTDRHPVVAGVRDYVVHDELYYNVVIPPELEVQVHARALFAEWVTFPMVLTAEGGAGRCPGAGKTAYLANGHSMQSMEPPAIRQLCLNTLRWLLT
jgi:type 1 glutamine amidotransferase